MNKEIKMKRILAMLSILGLASLASAGVAEAHQPNVSASCRGLTAEFTDYPGTNYITLTIDGTSTVLDPFTGSADFSQSWDSGVDHSWMVVVDAGDDDFDTVFSGETEACVTTTTPTTTTSATTTTVAATTTTDIATTTSIAATTTVHPTLPKTGANPQTIASIAIGVAFLGFLALVLSTLRRRPE